MVDILLIQLFGPMKILGNSTLSSLGTSCCNYYKWWKQKLTHIVFCSFFFHKLFKSNYDEYCKYDDRDILKYLESDFAPINRFSLSVVNHCWIYIYIYKLNNSEYLNFPTSGFNSDILLTVFGNSPFFIDIFSNL